MEAYTTVKQAAFAEFTEKKSRFIGYISSVKTEDEAAEFLSRIRLKHRDATHNCYAYSLKSNTQRYSDDGEPSGTAGIPILEILRKTQVVDAAIVVTRYFGGTMLGAGGLVRAYSNAAKLALEAAGLQTMQPCTVFALEISYPLYDRVNLLLQKREITVLHDDFSDVVSLRLRIGSEKFPELEHALTELSGGSLTPVILYEEFA